MVGVNKSAGGPGPLSRFRFSSSTPEKTMGAPGLAVFETWESRRLALACFSAHSTTGKREQRHDKLCSTSHRVNRSDTYDNFMPWRLERHYGGGDLHFITCSCYHRLPLLRSARRRDLFLQVLEQVRRTFQFVVIGYVVMPEHFHLLVSEPNEKNLSEVMHALKLSFARRVIEQERRKRDTHQGKLFSSLPQRIWQARFYDFNVCTERKRLEKLRYLHRNPVKRGLVSSTELWRWSSFREYAFNEKGTVRLNDWSVLKLKIIPPTRFGDVRQMPASTSTQVSKTARPGAPRRYRRGWVDIHSWTRQTWATRRWGPISNPSTLTDSIISANGGQPNLVLQQQPNGSSSWSRSYGSNSLPSSSSSGSSLNSSGSSLQ
jgi:putative transposase